MKPRFIQLDTDSNKNVCYCSVVVLLLIELILFISFRSDVV